MSLIHYENAILEFNPVWGDLRDSTHPELRPERILRILMLDRWNKKFLIPFSNTAFLLVRPVNDVQLGDIIADYWGSIWEYDPAGETVFVDFAFGEGYYKDFVTVLKGTGRKHIAWEHKGRAHKVLLESLHCF